MQHPAGDCCQSENRHIHRCVSSSIWRENEKPAREEEKSVIAINHPGSTGIEHRGERFSHTGPGPIGASHSGRNPVRTANHGASRRWSMTEEITDCRSAARILAFLPSLARFYSTRTFFRWRARSYFLADNYSRRRVTRRNRRSLPPELRFGF